MLSEADIEGLIVSLVTEAVGFQNPQLFANPFVSASVEEDSPTLTHTSLCSQKLFQRSKWTLYYISRLQSPCVFVHSLFV